MSAQKYIDTELGYKRKQLEARIKDAAEAKSRLQTILDAIDSLERDINVLQMDQKALTRGYVAIMCDQHEGRKP